MTPDRFQSRMNVLIRQAGSSAALARLAGVSESVVRKWRNGASEPSRERLVALAKATGCSVAWLATGEGRERRDDNVNVAETRVDYDGARSSLDTARLSLALQAFQEEIGGRAIPPDKSAELIGLMYDLLGEGMPEATIRRIARTTV